MTLCDLITELQNIADRFGDCDVQIANNSDDILGSTWGINRICLFKDGEYQTVIIIEE